MGADLADIQLIKEFNKIIRFLLCLIDIFYKFSWVVWAGKGSKIYNGSIKLSLEQNAVKMYSTHDEGKFVIVDRLIRTLKIKFISI